MTSVRTGWRFQPRRLHVTHHLRRRRRCAGPPLAAGMDARRVRDQQLRALGIRVRGDGRTASALRWDKLDYDTWRIRPARRGRVTVEFDYQADTLDNAMSWTKPDFVLFNGTNLFLYPEGQPLDFPADGDGAHGAGVPRRHEHDVGAVRRGIYRAANYHDLVDMPFFVGHFDLDSAAIVRTSGCDSPPIRRGACPGERRADRVGAARARDPRGSARVRRERRGTAIPLMQIVDSTYPGASGLEHSASSHVDVLSTVVRRQRVPAVALRARDLPRVEREAAASRGDVAVPLRSSAADAVALGERRDHRLLRRSRRGARRRRRSGGLLRAHGRRRSARVEGTPPFALEDASVNTWVHPLDGTELHLLSQGFAGRPAARHHDPRRQRQRALARRRDARAVPVDVQAGPWLHERRLLGCA